MWKSPAGQLDWDSLEIKGRRKFKSWNVWGRLKQSIKFLLTLDKERENGDFLLAGLLWL